MLAVVDATAQARQACFGGGWVFEEILEKAIFWWIRVSAN